MSSTSDDAAAFGPIRAIFWPIHRHELKKIIPMLLMLALVCFNYNIVRNLKDSVVVTAQSSGAIVIPFIKLWVMLPMAILLTIAFTKLSNRFSQERVFYVIISGFLIFFALFATVLYPLRDTLHPHATADALEQALPAGFKGLIAMFRNWSFTLFYVMAELWGSIVLTMLFWGFVNEVTKIGEAHRFYSMFTIAMNIAAILAGLFGGYFSHSAFNPSLPFGSDGWEQSLIQLTGTVVFFGFIVMGIFRWMNKRVLQDPSFNEFHAKKAAFKTKNKLSFRESFKYLFQSRYLICIAVLVVAYNLCIHLVEVIWKDQLRLLCPSPADYNKYMNSLTSWVGIIAMVMAMFTSRMLTRFGWTRVALITPMILLITSGGFFTFFFFRDQLSDVVFSLTGSTPLAIAVLFGAAQNCLTKAAKYSVFDTTKEMAFIPLSHECKVKGKAAIDGVGSRLAKSSGSLVYQGLLMVFATLAGCAPYVAALVSVAIALWVMATRLLGKQFENVLASQEEQTEQIEIAQEVQAPVKEALSV